jgi:hypothetical protein
MVKVAGSFSQRWCKKRVMKEGRSTSQSNIVRRGSDVEKKGGVLVASEWLWRSVSGSACDKILSTTSQRHSVILTFLSSLLSSYTSITRTGLQTFVICLSTINWDPYLDFDHLSGQIRTESTTLQLHNYNSKSYSEDYK